MFGFSRKETSRCEKQWGCPVALLVLAVFPLASQADVTATKIYSFDNAAIFGAHQPVWADGHLHGVTYRSNADSTDATGFWKFNPETRTWTLSSPEGDTNFYTAGSLKALAANSQGVVYSGVSIRNGCPASYYENIDDGVLLHWDYNTLFRQSPGMAPERLPVVDGKVRCMAGIMAVDAQDNLYVQDDGDGTTASENRNLRPAGAGTLWRLSRDAGSYTNLRVFQAATDGSTPLMILPSADGYLYGLNGRGGTNSRGTIYKLRADGSEFQVLHHFTPAQGNVNSGLRSLSEASPDDGYLYGSTARLGPNASLIFRLKKDGSEFRELFQFNLDNSDGNGAVNGLYPGVDGKLYGFGKTGGLNGTGTLFSIDPKEVTADSHGVEIIYHFPAGVTITHLTPATNGKLYALGGGVDQGFHVYELDVGYVPPVMPEFTAFQASLYTVVWRDGAAASDSMLSWDVKNAERCEASGAWSQQNVPVNGSAQVTPAQKGANSYTLTCFNSLNQNVSRSVTIDAVPDVSIDSFTANASEIMRGSSVVLSWATSNALSCSASWSKIMAEDKLASGFAILTPVGEASSVDYTLSCTGQSGSTISKSVTVAVKTGASGDGGGVSTSMEVSDGGGPVAPWLLLSLSLLVMRRRQKPHQP